MTSSMLSKMHWQKIYQDTLQKRLTWVGDLWLKVSTINDHTFAAAAGELNK